MRCQVIIVQPHYVIFDPALHLKGSALRFFGLNLGACEERKDGWFADIGVGLTLWEGTYEGAHDRRLRYFREDGTVIPTGAEFAEQERQRAEGLLAQLRALGVEPQPDNAE
jgi:hypothetical protein